MGARLFVKLHLLEEAKKCDDMKKARQAKQIIRKYRTISHETDFIHSYRLSEDLINILENELTPYLRPRIRSSVLTTRLKVCLQLLEI